MDKTAEDMTALYPILNILLKRVFWYFWSLALAEDASFWFLCSDKSFEGI